MPYLNILEVCSRRGAIYKYTFTLPYFTGQLLLYGTQMSAHVTYNVRAVTWNMHVKAVVTIIVSTTFCSNKPLPVLTVCRR